jgi:adenylosuccinate lyase
MVGRTHGIHAEPITFGFKLANWYSETQRNIARFMAAAEDMRVGKFSGAVGIFAHLTPELEEKICARLGLKAAAVSSQVIQRDRHAHYLSTLAVIASTLDKIATCNAPKCARQKSSSAKSKRDRPPCRTSAIP